MLRGDFAQAWRASDRIRQRGAPDPHRFWQGEPLAGRRVILRCLHGFGDAVQFLRYAPNLRALASHVTVEVPPRLLELARCFDGVDEVITWDDEAPAWDVQIEVMELAYFFRTQLTDLPIATRYLRLPASPPRSGFRVGLAWTSGDWNPARSIPFPLVQPLLAPPGCEFINLQHHAEPACALLPDPQASASVFGLASTIAQLDLAITVDTLAAHLAGALGIPCWVLLQHDADWRWMLNRDDSPWYPSLRLFRQPSPGDWVSVIKAVSSQLASNRLSSRDETIAKP
jgi:hypothetical protein